MAALRNHWIRFIYIALPDAVGMSMDVCDHFHFSRSAFLPYEIHFGTIEFYISLKAFRVNNVVWQERLNVTR